MKLADFLDGIEAEARAAEQRLDIQSIVARARAKGLIQTARDETALTPAARRLVRKLDEHLPPLDRESGEKAASLGKGLVKTSWIDVTPDMAETWLKRNFNNRPVSQDTVNAYAREMKRGRWMPVHQGIAFDVNDALVDGQHRLLAIVKSGCTVRLMVTFGLPSKIEGTRMVGMDVVDRGRTRTVADQLKIQHNIHGGTVLAMICNRLAAICSPERTRRLSVGEILDIHDQFQAGVDWMIEARPREHGLKQAGVLAAFAFAYHAEGADWAKGQLETYWHQLTNPGQELNPQWPIAHLRLFLTSEAAILLSRGNDRALAELVLQALMLQQRGHTIMQLTHALDGVNYFRECQPERVATIAGMFALPDVKPLKTTEAKKGRKAA